MRIPVFMSVHLKIAPFVTFCCFLSHRFLTKPVGICRTVKHLPFNSKLFTKIGKKYLKYKKHCVIIGFIKDVKNYQLFSKELQEE